VYRSIVVIAPLGQAEAVEEKCLAILAARQFRVQDVLHRLSVAEDRAEVTFKVSVRHQLQSGAVLRAVAALEGVADVRWF